MRVDGAGAEPLQVRRPDELHETGEHDEVRLVGRHLVCESSVPGRPVGEVGDPEHERRNPRAVGPGQRLEAGGPPSPLAQGPPPGPTAPQAYAQPPYGYAVQPRPKNGFGTAALVLGIIGLVLFWTIVLGVVLGVLALVFGILGHKRANRGE